MNKKIMSTILMVAMVVSLLFITGNTVKAGQPITVVSFSGKVTAMTSTTTTYEFSGITCSYERFGKGWYIVTDTNGYPYICDKEDDVNGDCFFHYVANMTKKNVGSGQMNNSISWDSLDVKNGKATYTLKNSVSAIVIVYADPEKKHSFIYSLGVGSIGKKVGSIVGNELNKDGSRQIISVTEPETTTVVSQDTVKKKSFMLNLNAGLKCSQKGKKIKVSWGKVAEADGYLVSVARCGTKFSKNPKEIKGANNLSTAIKKVNGKVVNGKKNYKIRVKAYKVVEGKKVIVGKTIMAHIVGAKNKKYTNPKAVKITSEKKVVLTVGKSSKIKAKIVLTDKNKKSLSDAHAKKIRYISSDSDVATVNKKGVITAKKAGTCYVYVFAKNGYARKVTVNVK